MMSPARDGKNMSLPASGGASGGASGLGGGIQLGTRMPRSAGAAPWPEA